jgi:hypothetical protein
MMNDDGLGRQAPNNGAARRGDATKIVAERGRLTWQAESALGWLEGALGWYSEGALGWWPEGVLGWRHPIAM